MKAESGPGSRQYTLEVLTFWIQGITLGADAAQIREMMRPDEAEARGLTILRIENEIAFPGEFKPYAAPMVILVREADSIGIMIDRPETIVNVELESIQPLPAMIEAYGLCKGIWAALVTNETIVLLIDFLKLCRARAGAGKDGGQA